MTRADRLLRAASDLFVRLGYEKTTVSDLTRAAGVSKGAFYLAFPSKDGLFEALLLREMRDYLAAAREALAVHPRAGSIGALYEVALRGLEASPVMAVLLRRDRDVFGRYLRQPDNFFRKFGAGHQSRGEVLAQLQAVGVVRPDVDVDVAAHVMNLISVGWVTVDEVLDTPAPPAEEVIAGLAAMMERALGPTQAVDLAPARALVDRMYAEGIAGLNAMLAQAEGGP